MAYTFHLMTTFHNTLGEGFHFLFYFKIFYSFYIFMMICFLISIIALNLNHSFLLLSGPFHERSTLNLKSKSKGWS